MGLNTVEWISPTRAYPIYHLHAVIDILEVQLKMGFFVIRNVDVLLCIRNGRQMEPGFTRLVIVLSTQETQHFPL